MRKAGWMLGACLIGLFLPEPAGAGIPVDVSPKDFQNIKASSPFTRSLNLPNNMILTGVAELEGEDVAMLMDSETGESVMVSSAKNSMGWTLLKVTGPEDIKDAIATVSSGDGQSFRVGYDRRLHDEVMKKKAKRVAETRRQQSASRSAEEKKKQGEMIKQRWNSLSQEQQAEARRIIAEKHKANPRMSSEDRGTMYNKVIDYVRSKK